MNATPVTADFVLDAEHGRVLKTLRAALKKRGLTVPLEFDAARSIRQEMGVQLAPCRVLCVCCPLLLLHSAVVDDSGMAFFPLHVVVSRHQRQTRVRVPLAAALGLDSLPASVREHFVRLTERVIDSLKDAGARQLIRSTIGDATVTTA